MDKATNHRRALAKHAIQKIRPSIKISPSNDSATTLEMSVFYKDFSKEAKDLLTKNTAEGKGEAPAGFAPLTWKVESKLKPKKDVNHGVVINPVADEKGMTANVELLCPFGTGAVIKFNVKRDVCQTKPTVTYEFGSRKVEASLATVCNFGEFELVYEDKQPAYTVVAKLTPTTLTVEDSFPVVSNVVLGCGLETPLKGFNFAKWTAGVRWKCCADAVVSVTTKAAKSFNFACVCAVPGVQLAGKNVQSALQVDYDLAKKAVKATLGFAGACVMCPGATWKVKLDSALNVSLSHAIDVQGWKIATTFDVSQRAFGVLATRE